MTIVDELGKASAKVLGSLSLDGEKGGGISLEPVDKGGLAPWEWTCRKSVVIFPAGPASSCSHHQCIKDAE